MSRKRKTEAYKPPSQRTRPAPAPKSDPNDVGMNSDARTSNDVNRRGSKASYDSLKRKTESSCNSPAAGDYAEVAVQNSDILIAPEVLEQIAAQVDEESMAQLTEAMRRITEASDYEALYWRDQSETLNEARPRNPGYKQVISNAESEMDRISSERRASKEKSDQFNRYNTRNNTDYAGSAGVDKSGYFTAGAFMKDDMRKNFIKSRRAAEKGLNDDQWRDQPETLIEAIVKPSQVKKGDRVTNLYGDNRTGIVRNTQSVGDNVTLDVDYDNGSKSQSYYYKGDDRTGMVSLVERKSPLTESENNNAGNLLIGQVIDVIVTDAGGTQFLRPMEVTEFYPADSVLMRDNDTQDSVVLEFDHDASNLLPNGLVYQSSDPQTSVTYRFIIASNALSNEDITSQYITESARSLITESLGSIIKRNT